MLTLSASAQPSASLGFDFSTGTYGGTSRTDTLSLPIGFTFTRGAFTGSLSTSYLRITGDGSYVPGVGAVGKLRALRPRTGLLARRFATAGSSLPTVTTEQGLGDVILSNSFQLPAFGPTAPTFRLGLETKLALANADQGLGSGENDYAPKFSLALARDQWGCDLDVGYRFFGDPAGVDLRNGLFGATSIWFTTTPAASISVSLSAAQATSAGESSSATLGLGYAYTFDAGISVSFSLSKGLTAASADYSVGGMVTFAF